MIIRSDFHIHSEYSYDATLPISEIWENAKKFGFRKIGITDHANYNDEKFLRDIKASSDAVQEFSKIHPEVILGVELTPIAKPEFDYIAKYGTREGYIPPEIGRPYEIELALTKEEMKKLGIRYAIGATHWRVDIPGEESIPKDKDAMIREWYRQQLWLANDPRVTILGHPWFGGKDIWYEDFSVIPRSMNMDIAEALKKNGKFVEYNTSSLFLHTSEKFRRQYAEFMRELFEMGIPITYGSDSHRECTDRHIEAEKILESVGFREGDFTELCEKDFII